MGSAQRVVILAGLPGSGKTTLAHKLAAYGFVWINQDAMGSRQNCERAFTEALSAHKDIVVDRCNFDQAQRSTWLSYARAYGVQCIGVQLIIPIQVCIERALARKDHPTLGTKGSIHEVIPKFARDFRLMFEKEGYSRVFTIKQQSDIEAFMRFISQQGQANRLQQRLPGPPSMQGQPPVMTGASQHAAPRQWQPSGPHRTGASWHAAPQQWLSPDPHNSAAAGTWRLREGLECHHSEAHGMDADGGANGMPGMRHANSHEQYNGVSSNIVTFPAHRRVATPLGNTGEAAQRFLDVPEPGAAQDSRPILLFDLNGTLTSHTAARRSAGINLMRPGIHHLMRLQEVFRLGLFSSASQKTVSTVIPMLEQAAAPGRTSAKDKLLPYRHLILTRSHTVAAPKSHVKNGGKAWDTVKPLHKWFKDLSRVLLVDDDSYKAVKGEEANMIIIPRWEEESNDVVLAALTASLLDGIRNMRDFQSRDMRQHSRAVMEAMPQHINKLRARAQQDDIEIDLTSESSVECEEMMKEVHIESRQAELASV